MLNGNQARKSALRYLVEALWSRMIFVVGSCVGSCMRGRKQGVSLGRSTLVGTLACGWWQTGGQMQGPVCYVYVSSRKAVCSAVHLMASEVSVSPNAGGMHMLCLLGQIWGFNWAEEQTVSEGWGP